MTQRKGNWTVFSAFTLCQPFWKFYPRKATSIPADKEFYLGSVSINVGFYISVIWRKLSQFCRYRKGKSTRLYNPTKRLNFDSGKCINFFSVFTTEPTVVNQLKEKIRENRRCLLYLAIQLEHIYSSADSLRRIKRYTALYRVGYFEKLHAFCTLRTHFVTGIADFSVCIERSGHICPLAAEKLQLLV